MKLKRLSLFLLVVMMMIGTMPVNAEPAGGAKDHLSDADDYQPIVQSLHFRKQIKFYNYKGKDRSGILNFELVPDENANKLYKHHFTFDGEIIEEEDLRIFPGIMTYSYKVPFSSDDYVDDTFNELGRKLIDKTMEGQDKSSEDYYKCSYDFADHALLHEWGRVRRSDGGFFLRVGPLKPEQFKDYGEKAEYEKQKKMIKDYANEGKKVAWDGDPDTEDIIGWKSSNLDGTESQVNPLYDFLGSYEQGEAESVKSECLLDREDFLNGSMKASEVYNYMGFPYGSFNLMMITRPIAISKQVDKDGNILSIEKPLFPSLELKKFSDKHDHSEIEYKYRDYEFYGEKILRYRLREKKAEGIDLDISGKEIIVDYAVNTGNIYMFEDEKSADEFYEKALYREDENGNKQYNLVSSLSLRDAEQIVLQNCIAYTNITIQKAWKDEDNKYKDRPKDVKVKLYADGKYTGKILKLSEKDKWSGTINNLPSKQDGKDIEYTVKEVKVANYDAHIDGNEEDGFVITNTHKEVNKPATGDNSHTGMYIAALILAAALALILIIIKKKKK